MIKKRWLTMMVLFVFSLCTVAIAEAETKDVGDNIEKSIIIEDDLIENASVIEKSECISGDQNIEKIVYELQDGTIVKDVIKTPTVSILSKNGTDKVVRTRTISGWGTITLSASFKWYTKKYFSYVKCEKMNATYSVKKGIIVDKWKKSYTKDYVSIGKAHAQVSYYFYHKNIPTQYKKGTFKITCSDSGTISDNG